MVSWPLLSPGEIAAWQHATGWRRTALALAARAYRRTVSVRNAFHDARWLPEYRAPFPVISVGNLEAGGTGKTAVVRHLAERLPGHVAIVTRGYGHRLRRLPHEVDRWDPAGLVGDEPRLLKRWLPHVPVVVSERRHRAVPLIGGRADWVLLDDGFQHRALHRDADIVLVPPSPAGQFLPLGMAREPFDSLRRATVVWIHGVQRPDDAIAPLVRRLRGQWPHLTVVTSAYHVDAILPYEVWRGDRTRRAGRVAGHLPAASFPAVSRTAGGAPRWHVVTAIARPDRVGRLLVDSGHVVVGKTSYRDHRYIPTTDLDAIWKARSTGAEALLMTEKDAIRYDEKSLHGIEHIPLYILTVSVRIVHGARRLGQILDRIAARRFTVKGSRGGR